MSQPKEMKPSDASEDASHDGLSPKAADEFPKRTSAPERRQRQEQQRRRARRVNVIRTVLLMAVAFAVGCAVSFFVLPRASVPAPVPGTKSLVSLPGRVTVTEAELDTPIGSYTHKGAETVVTVREAIEEGMSLEAARNADGTYDIPSADSVLSIARNHFLLADAQERGITVSDEDVSAYAKEVWKTDDLAVIAASYSMSKDQVANLMKESATIKKLRDQVIASKLPEEPKEPNAPEDGKNDDPKPEYGEYVVALMGDEWNKGANTWAREDGPFHEELKNYTISNDGATYSAALAAYNVAKTQRAAAEQQVSTEWTNYVNQILSDVTVQLGTLVA